MHALKEVSLEIPRPKLIERRNGWGLAWKATMATPEVYERAYGSWNMLVYRREGKKLAQSGEGNLTDSFLCMWVSIFPLEQRLADEVMGSSEGIDRQKGKGGHRRWFWWLKGWFDYREREIVEREKRMVIGRREKEKFSNEFSGFKT